MKDSRKPLIAGNWKMYKSIPESVETAKRLIELTTDTDIEIVIAPAFTSLFSVYKIIKNSDSFTQARENFNKTLNYDQT